MNRLFLKTIEEAQVRAKKLVDKINEAWGGEHWEASIQPGHGTYAAYAAKMGELYVVPLAGEGRYSGFYRATFGGAPPGEEQWNLQAKYRDPVRCAKDQYERVLKMYGRMSRQVATLGPWPSRPFEETPQELDEPDQDEGASILPLHVPRGRVTIPDGIAVKEEPFKLVAGKDDDFPELCGIPGKVTSPCDLPWGHSGDTHLDGEERFYATDYDMAHKDRQLRRLAKESG